MAPQLQLHNGRWRGGGLNLEGYVMQVLNGPLKDFIAQMEKVKGHRMLVVEDGALAHQGKLAKQAWEELGIKQIAHPPSSPDLNVTTQLGPMVQGGLKSVALSPMDYQTRKKGNKGPKGMVRVAGYEGLGYDL
ncbi:hypothetical protein RhiXN_12068 [Rhizoctonia solani]|uniref:Tc1-like transposase DDE domain-containing protein n=1 Tax=Rhizoctonia solani TaxID=456999 RepID=A0A8H8P8S7_9AGAM|nr:uncharacterized protein RhiXN_12068 [Rhizoctonia solani]QRW26407.1 hypothetical protein RhiXN_12068 [Rhizoctonia solani]